MPDITFTGGPLDGTTRTVGEPWPRESYLYEPTEGEVYTYRRDSADSTEPYTFVYYTVTDYVEPADDFEDIPESQDWIDPQGMQGEQGPKGELGARGPDGVDGDNMEFVAPPSYYYALRPQDDFAGWDPPSGWPVDLVPIGTIFGVPPGEPGSGHEYIVGEDRITDPNSSSPIPMREYRELPPGLYSLSDPIDGARYWSAGWFPWNQTTAPWTSNYVMDPYAHTTEDLGRDYMTWIKTSAVKGRWRITINGFLRRRGPLVLLALNFVSQGDWEHYYTPASVNRLFSESEALGVNGGFSAEVYAAHPPVPNSWYQSEINAGRSYKIGPAPNRAPRDTNLSYVFKNQKLMQLPAEYMPLGDDEPHFIMSCFSAQIFSSSSLYVDNFVFKIDRDGFLIAVDGPGGPDPVFDWWEGHGLTEWRAW